MKKFLFESIRFIVIGLIPVVLLFISYLYFDPFKVIRNYNNYSYAYVIPNRDVVSTQMFIRNYPKYHYDSFVFGSSRTLAYLPEVWGGYLNKNTKIFMFDASGESVYGIYTKLKYLDSLHIKINNALIILDRDVSFSNFKNHEGHLFAKDPATSGENKLLFQVQFFKAYLGFKFLPAFYAYTFTHKYKSYMKGYIENRKIVFDTITNKQTILDQEKAIVDDSVGYYQSRENIFYKRLGESVDTLQRIKGKYIFLLNGIKQLLEKNNANYKVVLSPLYDQMKFNLEDQKTLQSIFGARLYDFTGKNKFTESKYNYYEVFHYRPKLGDSIIKVIYKHK